jgi:hypothetical protein
MSTFKFPKDIYVHEPLQGEVHLDAYTDLEGVEEDDTVAIYHLVEVCRVKVQKKTQLVLDRDPRIIYKDEVKT